MVTMQFPHRKEKRSREGRVCGSVMFYEENRLNRSDTTLADDNISTPSVHEPIVSP
jgi:hypothetical protein